MQKNGLVQVGDKINKQGFKGNQHVSSKTVADAKLTQIRNASLNKIVSKAGGALALLVTADDFNEYRKGNLTGADLTINLLKTAVPYAVGAISAPAGVVVGVGILAFDVVSPIVSPAISRGTNRINQQFSTERSQINFFMGGQLDAFVPNFDFGDGQ